MFKLKEDYRRSEAEIKHSKEVVKYLDDIKDADRECFVCLHLNTRLAVIHKEVVSIGTLNESIIHPREIFKGAILNSASSIIIAHNPPSGDTEPSQADLDITKQLRDAGHILGIELLDHIIVSGNTHHAMSDHREGGL